MKNFKKGIFLAIVCLSSIKLQGYAISHNSDSQLPEVTIFVFADSNDFKKMLKSQGVAEKTLKDITALMPKITATGSLAATALGNPELIPVISAIGAALTAAAKYGSAGPLRYIMQQRYNVAIHKHTHRGNKGKDAEWNWADIEKDKGISPNDPYGLFAVFLNPDNKQVLLMTPLQSNAAFGFKAVKDPKTGKFMGEEAPFERNMAESAAKNPSSIAQLFAYVKNRYENPHKILWDIKSSFKDVKEKLISFSKKYPGTKNKLDFLSAQLDEVKNKIKNYDPSQGTGDVKNLIDFFKKEIESAKIVAADPETKRLANRVIAKFNLVNMALQDTIAKPLAGYNADMEKIGKEKEKTKAEAAEEAELFESLGEDYIAPIPNVGLEEAQ